MLGFVPRDVEVGFEVGEDQNDRFRVGTDKGDLLVRVSRVERPVGIIDSKQRVNDHLAEHKFPAPRSVFTGRLVSARRSVDERRCVQHLSNTRQNHDMPASIGFRPTPDDERMLRDAARPGESTSATLRRALRLLDHDRWLAQFHNDAGTLTDEDLNAEPEAW